MEKTRIQSKDLNDGDFKLRTGQMIEYTFHLLEESGDIENFISLSSRTSPSEIGMVFMKNKKVYAIPSIANTNTAFANDHKISILPSVKVEGSQDIDVEQDDDLDSFTIEKLISQM